MGKSERVKGKRAARNLAAAEHVADLLRIQELAQSISTLEEYDRVVGAAQEDLRPGVEKMIRPFLRFSLRAKLRLRKQFVQPFQSSEVVH